MKLTSIISIIVAVSASISGILAHKPKTNRLRGRPSENQVVDIIFEKDDQQEQTLDEEDSLVDSSNSEGCARDRCMNPAGECASVVQCFIDPCQFARCGENETCTPNFCGGCHAICSQVSEQSNEDGDSASLQIGKKP